MYAILTGVTFLSAIAVISCTHNPDGLNFSEEFCVGNLARQNIAAIQSSCPLLANGNINVSLSHNIG